MFDLVSAKPAVNQVAGDCLWIESFPGVSLTEINENAARQVRIDRKYVVPLAVLPSLMQELQSAQVLEIAGERLLAYSSLYLDDAQNTAYFLAGRKRRRRYKVRIRTYQNGSEYLEVKWKDGRKQTHKFRRAHNGELPLSADAIDFVNSSLALGGIKELTSWDLQPAIETKYQRVTFYLPDQAARATIDFGLQCNAKGTKYHLNQVAIIETKAGAQLTSLDKLLHRYGYRETRISKFSIGLINTMQLPATKWTRTLRQLESLERCA